MLWPLGSINADEFEDKVSQTTKTNREKAINDGLVLFVDTDNDGNQDNGGNWDNGDSKSKLHVLGFKDNKDKLKSETNEEEKVKENKSFEEQQITETALEAFIRANLFENCNVVFPIEHPSQERKDGTFGCNDAWNSNDKGANLAVGQENRVLDNLVGVTDLVKLDTSVKQHGTSKEDEHYKLDNISSAQGPKCDKDLIYTSENEQGHIGRDG